MALRNQPYIPLYVQDFLTDEKLIECSAQSTGVFIRLICIMHKSEEYGTILLKQKDKQSNEQDENFALKLVKQMPYSFEIILSSIKELLAEKVIFLDGDILGQSRMINDNSLSIKRAKAGKKGGKFAQAKLKASVKAKDKANTEYEYEIEIEDENIIKNENKSKKNKSPKIQILEFVSMTEEENSKLVKAYGQLFTNQCIEVLNNYKGSSGKNYKNDYLAILNWVVAKVKKENNGKQNGLPQKTLESCLITPPSGTPMGKL
jgi:hypothetical protein